MLVRREKDADAEAVRWVEAEAFRQPDVDGEPPEAWLAAELRKSGAVVPGLSLVAMADGQAVGHVVCSRGWVEPDGHAAVGLGPLAVLPAYQGQGVGSALMHGVLGAADALDEPLVALLGSPAFYKRFGFETSTVHAITPPDPAWAEHFQVRVLTAHRPDIAGTFRYAAGFDGL